jgi:hypothetical protein
MLTLEWHHTASGLHQSGWQHHPQTLLPEVQREVLHGFLGTAQGEGGGHVYTVEVVAGLDNPAPTPSVYTSPPPLDDAQNALQEPTHSYAGPPPNPM